MRPRGAPWRARAAWLACSAMIACGSPAAPQPAGESSRGDDQGGEESEGADRDTESRAPGECPSRFGALGPTCSGDDVPSGCTYPEGECMCAEPTYCGGAAPPPMPLGWRCYPTPTPCPTEGTPCAATDPVCTFDECGWRGVRCADGRWQLYMTPPPP